VKFRYDLNSISAKASPQGLTDGRLINPRAAVINSKREPVRMQEKLAEARGVDQCGTFLRSSVRLKRAKLIDSTRRFSDRCDLELPCRNRGIDRPICTAGVSCLLALGAQLDRFDEAVERSRVHVVYVDYVSPEKVYSSTSSSIYSCRSFLTVFPKSTKIARERAGHAIGPSTNHGYSQECFT